MIEKGSLQPGDRLVAEAFLGPCPAGHEVNHKNGDKDDNRAVNLQWASHPDNQRHAFATGLQLPSSGKAAAHAVKEGRDA